MGTGGRRSRSGRREPVLVFARNPGSSRVTRSTAARGLGRRASRIGTRSSDLSSDTPIIAIGCPAGHILRISVDFSPPAGEVSSSKLRRVGPRPEAHGRGPATRRGRRAGESRPCCTRTAPRASTTESRPAGWHALVFVGMSSVRGGAVSFSMAKPRRRGHAHPMRGIPFRHGLNRRTIRAVIPMIYESVRRDPRRAQPLDPAPGDRIMASQAQINANRQNAQKSTGPKSPGWQGRHQVQRPQARPPRRARRHPGRGPRRLRRRIEGLGRRLEQPPVADPRRPGRGGPPRPRGGSDAASAPRAARLTEIAAEAAAAFDARCPRPSARPPPSSTPT